jgi:hypothetical protein
MLRAMLRVCCVQHPIISGPPPSSPMLRPSCDYIAAMLWPVLRATSNIRSSPPLLLNTNPNIACLQHRNSTYATLRFNVYNIQHMGPSSSTQHPTSHICNIETQHPQHRKLMFATLKLFRSNFETFTWTTRNIYEHRCNMFRPIATWRQTITPWRRPITTCQEHWCNITWNTTKHVKTHVQHQLAVIAAEEKGATIRGAGGPALRPPLLDMRPTPLESSHRPQSRERRRGPPRPCSLATGSSAWPHRGITGALAAGSSAAAPELLHTLGREQ